MNFKTYGGITQLCNNEQVTFREIIESLKKKNVTIANFVCGKIELTRKVNLKASRTINTKHTSWNKKVLSSIVFGRSDKNCIVINY